jgi:hypothetical protein
MESIKLTIDFNEKTGEGSGEGIVEASGFVGKGCDVYQDAMHTAFGGEQVKTLKPEYFHSPIVTKSKTKLTQKG